MPISVTVGNFYNGDAIDVFCDWDGNTVLNDLGETFALTGVGAIFTGNITAPVGAAASTRMRVVLRYNGTANPCLNAYYGAIWDFTVNTALPAGLIGIGSATPASVAQLSPTVVAVAFSATSPPMPPTGVTATIDLSSIGGSPTETLYDDGTHGDPVPGDLTFSFMIAPLLTTAAGTHFLPWTASDSVTRTTSGTITLTVLPYNDGCATPTPLAFGPNGPFSNSGATDSGVLGSCSAGYKDIWFSYTPACTGSVTITTGCGGFDTVMQAYASCGGAELACNDDASGTGCGVSSSITFAGTAGTTYLIRVASYSSVNTGTFPVNVSSGAMGLAFSSPFGAGSIQVDMTSGPSAGSYFLALTFNAGAFPNGWLYGVDIPLFEVQNLLQSGPPFLAALDACGAATIGPISGAGGLAGVPFYAVALGLPAGSSVPSVHTSAVTYAIP